MECIGKNERLLQPGLFSISDFYTIERYKFLKSQGGFYISFDPYDESEKILDEDHGTILCKEIEGYFL